MKYDLCIFLILIFFSCNRPVGNSSNKVKVARNSSEQCIDIIHEIILNSYYKPIGGESKSSLTYFIDEMEGDFIRVGVSSETKENGAVNIGWLEFNLAKEEIQDVTVDPEEPTKISFDKKVFQKLKETCH